MTCPLGTFRCESCGAETEGIAAVIAESPAGPFCIAACPECRAAIERGTPQGISPSTTVRLAAQHVQHVRAAAADETD